MIILYSLIYSVLFAVLVPLYLIVRKIKGKPPVPFLSRLGIKIRKIKESERRPVWIHAVSVGEVLAAKPLVEKLREEYPYLPLVLSVTTETGKRAAAAELPFDLYIIDLPFDFAFSVRRYLNIVKPQLVIIMETELWPRFCCELNRRNIPLLLVNGRLSEKSFPKYRIVKPLMRKVLSFFTRLIVQTERYRERFIGVGAEPEKIEVVSSLKYHKSNFDIDREIRGGIKDKCGISDNDIIIVGGSTHKGEEEVLLDVFRRLKKKHARIRLVLVPRRPERFKVVEKLIKESGFRYCLRSKSETSADWEVMLVDQLGELKIFYSFARLVFVGGSLVPHGGQNLLEAAAFSVPVLFGPYISNFEEMAGMLLSRGGGCIVNDAEAMHAAMDKFLSSRPKYNKAAAAAYTVIEDNQRGVEVVFDIARKYIEC
jgi:3-deoxy-D-manno-octulosonic-acid transferase